MLYSCYQHIFFFQFSLFSQHLFSRRCDSGLLDSNPKSITCLLCDSGFGQVTYPLCASIYAFIFCVMIHCRNLFWSSLLFLEFHEMLRWEQNIYIRHSRLLITIMSVSYAVNPFLKGMTKLLQVKYLSTSENGIIFSWGQYQHFSGGPISFYKI